ncbi:MAG TPA: beta-ketoacyl synthase N-terminal-like domain-containing protein [Jatrophihabitans sp.]|jgi:acyl transferase domain-containing protein|uniref:polyketide synthase n=1 Tax=Jatrophihabitans sp. TaxID=1932789 RepID=UPI002F2442DE
MPVSSPGRVAVVGVGVRAPGGITGPASYWAAITDARTVIGELPADRRAAFGSQWDDLITRGGYLEAPFDFDARFFDMSPREARTVDPQHRLLLEVVWEAFEDAAMPPATVASATGVFVGITGLDYRQWLPSQPNSYTTVGNGHSFSAGRVAHELGLQGPVFAMDTACSSSLVAVHTACRALTAGDCDAAVAAGVNLILSPDTTRAVAQTGALSPDGSSRPFDAAANGFVRGEACGAVILKRLDDALRDRDRIHAVIDGSAINHDGRSPSFTAPNSESQTRLICSLLASTGLSGADVGYHEAHGTGTPLGDPIEMRAVLDAMRPSGGGPALHVGSVKGNLGHTESAAGVMGLIKAVLCLERGTIPPQAGFDTLNPRIDLAGTGLAIATGLRPWPAEAGTRATVSSYGMSGTNAFAVLSAAPAATGDAAPVPGFLVSARTPAALAELAVRYSEHLAGLDDADYPAFAYTATHGRTRLSHAAWVAAADRTAALDALAALDGRAGIDSHPAVRLLDGSEPLPWKPSPADRAVATLPTYAWQHVTQVVPTPVKEQR